MTLDTHPLRVQMLVYAHLHGLASEPGFETAPHDELGAPGRAFLQRIQTHMVAFKKKGKRVYPHVTESGVLDEATRAALTPNRPSWQDEFVRICRQDAANPSAAYYTQGAARWQGVQVIYGKVKVQAAIPYLRSGDCSAGFTRWMLWALQQHLGRVPADVVNGAHWQAGFTGTIAATMVRVRSGPPQIGDAALYGNAPSYHHVTGVIDPARKLCCSHGNNAGPVIERYDYRSALAGFWRVRLENA